MLLPRLVGKKKRRYSEFSRVYLAELLRASEAWPWVLGRLPWWLWEQNTWESNRAWPHVTAGNTEHKESTSPCAKGLEVWQLTTVACASPSMGQPPVGWCHNRSKLPLCQCFENSQLEWMFRAWEVKVSPVGVRVIKLTGSRITRKQHPVHDCGGVSPQGWLGWEEPL